ncbi:MAG: M1 family aminopeptidase [Pyrinomonadaceae bacterium]
MKSKQFVKNFYAVFLAFLLVFTQTAAARPLQNPFLQEGENIRKLPPVNWIRSRSIDVKHIAVDLRFDWEKEQALGISTVTAAPFKDTDKIYLDAAYMTINSVKTADGANLKFNYTGKDENDNLEIILPRVYKSGEDVTVKIDYATNYVNTADPDTAIGSFGRGLRFIKPNADQPNKPMQIWSQGETEFNRYWFPSYDAPNDFRTSELKVTVDKKYTVVSNGTLIDVKDNADGTKTFDWKMDTPYSNYLTSIVVGEYAEIKNGEYDGIPVMAYGYKSEQKEVAATTKNIVDMVKFFSETLGVKYAYPKYSQTMVEDFGGGMENISATTQIEEMIHDERELLDTDSEGLQAHELAHQWFGDYVTTRDWGQIWLNESFATYFDALYQEHKKGRDHFLYSEVRNNQNQVLQTWAQGNKRPIVTKYYANKDAMFDNYAYPGGASVLHMLRKHLGDELFFKSLNHYLISNAHQPVSTEDLRIAIEEATGQSMDWFFDQWLYKMGHPIFEITKNYDAAAKKLTMNVKQTQKLNLTNEFPQTEFFQTYVDVEIDGKVNRVWIKPQAENVFTFDSANEPKLVNFDYEGTILKELKFEKSTDELVYQLANDKDIIGRSWALNELTKKAKNAADKEKTLMAMRTTIEKDSSNEIRLAALQSVASVLLPSTPAGEIPKADLDSATIQTLLKAAKDQKSTIRANAISVLALTNDPKYSDLYFAGLKDQSYSVVEQSAIGLARTKNAKAFETLSKLITEPSWKGRIPSAALNGLAALGDKRSLEIGLKYAADKNQPENLRNTALKVVSATGKGDSRAYQVIFEAFKKHLDNNDFNALSSSVQAIINFADPRGQEAFDLLRAKYKDNSQIINYVTFLESQFKEAIKQK